MVQAVSILAGQPISLARQFVIRESSDGRQPVLAVWPSPDDGTKFGYLLLDFIQTFFQSLSHDPRLIQLSKRSNQIAASRWIASLPRKEDREMALSRFIRLFNK